MDVGYPELRQALDNAGLPKDPVDVLNRPYMFKSQSGDQVLVGRITAIDLSGEGGLQLQVTNSRLRGRDILYFIHSLDSGWAARHPDRPEDIKKLDQLPEDASEDEFEEVSDQVIENRFGWGTLTLL